MPAHKVAIVLASFQPREDFFRLQLDSIKNQTFKDWVCIIVDDNSGEEFTPLLRQLVESDSRFQLHLEKTNVGVFYNFERGLVLADRLSPDYDLIAFCDQDDIWENTKLEEQIKSFTDPRVTLSHSDMTAINDNGRQIHSSVWQMENRNMRALDIKDLIFRNNITGCTMMFRRRLLNKALPFPADNNPLLYFHDLWVALFALEENALIDTNLKTLVRYRQHSGNVIGAEQQRSSARLARFLNPRALTDKFSYFFLSRQKPWAEYCARIGKSPTYFPCPARAWESTAAFKTFIGYRAGKFLHKLKDGQP
jgi:glycosyltransferase involved in cell wall biosynthesis